MMIGTALWEIIGELSETPGGQFQDRPDAFVFNGQAGTVKIDKSKGSMILSDKTHNVVYDSVSPFGYDRARVLAIEAQLLAEMIELRRSQADRDRELMLKKLALRPF